MSARKLRQVACGPVGGEGDESDSASNSLCTAEVFDPGDEDGLLLLIEKLAGHVCCHSRLGLALKAAPYGLGLLGDAESGARLHLNSCTCHLVCQRRPFESFPP